MIVHNRELEELMARITAFVQLSRVQFLPMAALTYLIGIGIAGRDRDHLSMRMVWAGLIIELFVQLSISYFNDYWDMPTDRINTNRTFFSGGSGELTTGVLPPWIALAAGAVCQGVALLLALLIGIPAISWLVLLLAIGAVHAYTSPPLRLAWRGLGELMTSVVAALLVPAWAYSLQLSRVTSEILILGIPILFFIMSMFIVIAVPDVEPDRQVEKFTLPVLVGEHKVGVLYMTLVILGYIASVLLWSGRLPAGAVIGAAVSLPLGWWAWRGLRFPINPRQNALLFLIIRAGLVPAVTIVILNLGLRFG